MVRVVRLERTVSWSQTRRDTNFAIPGYSFFCHDTMARGKNKDFSVCGQSCGQSQFYTAIGNQRKSSKRRYHKALRRFASPYPGYRHGTPKAGALPTALHPVISLFYPAGRILPNQARYQLRYTRISDFPASAGKLFLILSCPAGKSNRRRTENLSAACTFMRPAPAGPAVPTAALRPPGTDPRRWTAGTCRPSAAPDSGR